MDFNTTNSTILAKTAVTDLSAIDKDTFDVGSVVADEVGRLAIRIDTSATTGQNLDDLPVTLLDDAGNEVLREGTTAMITKASSDTNLVSFTDPDMGAMPSFMKHQFESVELIFDGSVWNYVG